MILVVPLKVIETLKCVECHYYLSTPSVKVYKNGQIKCERCFKDNDDGGTISTLYGTVFKNTKFPCVNHYSGCKKLLYSHEVLQHEMVCPNQGFIYDCPECPNCDFRGTAYNLQYHLENNHKGTLYTLTKPEFYTDINPQREKSFICYYKEGSLIAFFYGKFEPEYKFSLGILCAMQEPFRNVKYKFWINNIDNICLLSSARQSCRYRYFHTFDYARFMNSNMLRDNKIIIRFEVTEKNVLMTPENIVYFEPTLSEAEFTCKFSNINSLKVDETAYSKTYYVGDFPWCLEISKRIVEEEPYLAIHLSTEHGVFQSRNVQAAFTLLSETAMDCEIDFHGKAFQKYDRGGFDDVISWNYLVDSDFGYVKNGGITIIVCLEIWDEKVQEDEVCDDEQDYEHDLSEKRVRVA